jgi:lipopolysaccharide export system permease protein
MRLLDRYLLRELLVPFGYCLIGFLIFWISSDVFTQLADFQKLRLKFDEVTEYYVMRLPEMLVTVLPIAFLLALLYTLTHHARHNELTAMRAAGVSWLRLSAPYLGAGLVFSLGVFAINELWAPQNVEAAEEVLNRHQPKRADPEHKEVERKVGFYNSRERRWWFAQSYHLVTARMIRPHVIWLPPDNTRREILAESAAYVSGMWIFTNVHRLVYSGEPGELPEQSDVEWLPMPEFQETPEQIKSEIKINKVNVGSLKSVRKAQLSLREILEYKRLHPVGLSPERAVMLDTKLHGRLAAPWTCLVVVLIALPFGAAPGRRNVAVGVAGSILICFVYFVLLQLALAVGTRGYVPPWIAAWSPNAFFALAGLALTWRMR